MRIGAHVQVCCVGNTLSGWYYHIDGHIIYVLYVNKCVLLMYWE